MIAKECCGSCEKFKLVRRNNEWSIKCKKANYDDFELTGGINDCYSPRNPIENPYQKMWEELKVDLSERWTDATNNYYSNALHSVENKMKTIQDKHK